METEIYNRLIEHFEANGYALKREVEGSVSYVKSLSADNEIEVDYQLSRIEIRVVVTWNYGGAAKRRTLRSEKVLPLGSIGSDIGKAIEALAKEGYLSLVETLSKS